MAPIATTSTFDATDDPSVLSEQELAEQEAYEIGDRLVSEHENQLLGKFNSVEELERAYSELERKLSQRGQEEPQEDLEEAEEEPEDESPDEEGSLLSRLFQEADEGEFSEETLALIDQTNQRDLINEFLAYREQNQPREAYEMSPQDVADMKGIVGGEQQYEAMCAWASENLPAEEVEVFDYVVTELGDPRAVYFAIQALNYRFREAAGYEPELLGGRAPSNSGDYFESHAQLVEALSDPRYERDPAYRASVEAKLERSGDLI
jgi:hypothetical protein